MTAATDPGRPRRILGLLLLPLLLFEESAGGGEDMLVALGWYGLDACAFLFIYFFCFAFPLPANRQQSSSRSRVTSKQRANLQIAVEQPSRTPPADARSRCINKTKTSKQVSTILATSYYVW